MAYPKLQTYTSRMKLGKLPKKGNVSMHFKEGSKTFSVQRHPGTYGYASGLFEISWWRGRAGTMKEPLGYLTEAKVNKYFNRWRKLT